MRRCVECIAIAGLLAALLGLVVALSGLVPIAASSGHWAVTEWLLHGTMRRAVQTQSMAIAVPPLDEPGLARRGAGHFATGCAPCHGAPGRAPDAFAAAMTPPPPGLASSVPTWDDAELFTIVRHGVKFTGMPAWPALAREDEVWAMVAFLRRLPELDAEGYDALAGAEPGCARCHGTDGAGSAAFPRLAGQNAAYLLASLEAYAEGRRSSGIMEQAVAGLDAEALQAAAAHYAATEAPAAEAPPGPEHGATLAREGDPARGIPACATCHGLEAGPRFAAYPVLAGQEAWYLEQQLRLLRAGERGGTAFAPIMQTVAERLSDADIAAVAAHFAGLRP